MTRPLAFLFCLVLVPALWLAFTLAGRVDDAVQLDAVSTSNTPLAAAPAPPADPCADLLDLHAGKGEVTRQHWFNHLDARGYARYWIACTKQWGTAEWECLDQLNDEESSWYHLADGPNGPAGDTWGIPQAYPGDKMRSHGPDWKTNPRVQVRWQADYIADRYGAPTATPRRCHAGY